MRHPKIIPKIGNGNLQFPNKKTFEQLEQNPGTKKHGLSLFEWLKEDQKPSFWGGRLTSHDFVSGSLHYQPKQWTTKGKSMKNYHRFTTNHWKCFPFNKAKWVKLIIFISKIIGFSRPISEPKGAKHRTCPISFWSASPPLCWWKKSGDHHLEYI